MTDDEDRRRDPLGRIVTDLLYQPFLEKLNALILACQARGAIYVATSGLRTYAEQDNLYAQGRTAPGKRVTNARGGYSPHNFGVAADFAPHVGGDYEGKLKTDYAVRNYAVLGEETAKLNLEWGGRWLKIKDTPHVQLPLKTRGITWEMMRTWYADGGLVEVYDRLDLLGGW